MTCRVFGPPIRSEDGLGVCELCYHGATDEEIAACEMKPDPDDVESDLLEKLEDSTGNSREHDHRLLSGTLSARQAEKVQVQFFFFSSSAQRA